LFQQREENERLLVFQQQKKMKGCWCFSNGKKNERLLVFQQREKLLLMVFQQWKGKKKKMKQVLDGVVSC
jgi:hypothetical protein